MPPLCLLGALLLLLSRGAAAARVTEALSDAALVGGGGWRGEQKETRGEERLDALRQEALEGAAGAARGALGGAGAAGKDEAAAYSRSACWRQLWNASVGTVRDPPALRDRDAYARGGRLPASAPSHTYFPGDRTPSRAAFLAQHASPGETPADVNKAAWDAMQQYSEFSRLPGNEGGGTRPFEIYSGLPQDEFYTWNDGQERIARDGLTAFNASVDARRAELRPLLERAAAAAEASDCPPSMRSVVGVITVNSGHIDQLLNQLCAAQANGLGRAFLARVLVFPMDEDALTTLKAVEEATGITVVPSVGGEAGTWYHNPQYKADPSQGAGIFGDGKFRVALHWKDAVVMDVLALGYDVLFMDADVAFLRPPWEALAEETDGCDATWTYDGKVWGKRDSDPQFGLLTFRGLNSGLALYRSNERTRAMWWEMLEKQNLHNSQQAVLKAVVMRAWWRHDLRVCMLSERFLGGHRIPYDNPANLPTDVVSLHASWVANSTWKVLKWRRQGHWYYTPQCAIYDQTHSSLGARAREDIRLTGSCLLNLFFNNQGRQDRLTKELKGGVVEGITSTSGLFVCEQDKVEWFRRVCMADIGVY